MNIVGRAAQIRWGVIGLGFFGEYHAEALSQLSAVELVAACTRRPDRLEEVADRYSIPRRYTDYRRMLADPEVDAVSIVTHVDDHLQIALDALAGGKHVLLEKPMAPTAAECDRIVDAARRSRGLFMVGHICRFDPRVVLAKQAIDENHPHSGYPGCYPLSKVLEEVMCEQYRIMYRTPITILRFSWVHDEDDILAHLTLKEPNFGVPVWKDWAVTPEQKAYFDRDIYLTPPPPRDCGLSNESNGTGST